MVVRPYVRNFIVNQSLHDPRDQVFVADAMITNPMWETVASNVNSQQVGVVAELIAITNICKYRGLQEGHHFIPTTMEVHDALGRDMDHFIKECACLFQDRRLGGHLSLYFYIQFSK
jgi:hypothetical protein